MVKGKNELAMIIISKHKHTRDSLRDEFGQTVGQGEAPTSSMCLAFPEEKENKD